MKLTIKKIRKLILEEIESKIQSPINIDITISDELKRCHDKKNIIEDFCNFCAQELLINEDINIKIVSNRDAENVKTTAFYDPNDHRIVVYGKNRAIVDICRSLCHEMVHMSQMLEDRISFPVQDAGGEIEDEANAKAGELIKVFAKSDESRREIYESVNKL